MCKVYMYDTLQKPANYIPQFKVTHPLLFTTHFIKAYHPRSHLTKAYHLTVSTRLSF